MYAILICFTVLRMCMISIMQLGVRLYYHVLLWVLGNWMNTLGLILLSISTGRNKWIQGTWFVDYKLYVYWSEVEVSPDRSKPKSFIVSLLRSKSSRMSQLFHIHIRHAICIWSCKARHAWNIYSADHQLERLST